MLKVLDVMLDTQIGSINSNFTKYVHTNLFTDHLHIAEKERNVYENCFFNVTEFFEIFMMKTETFLGHI